MRKALGNAARCTGLLLLLLLAYTLAMLMAYGFEDEWIADGVNAAVGILEEEGNMTGGYATYFWHNGFGITDNLTDKEIYRGLLRNGRSVIDSAMRTDYARYWHGYAVFLRPMLTVLSIINIRYLNMMLMFSLFLLVYWQIRSKLGAWAAFGFGAGLLMSFILIAPFCQQYCPVYLVTLMGCYGLPRFWKRLRNHLAEVFLTIGSLVCFFDFLTFPVLALGYPLLLCLLFKMQEGEGTKALWADLVVLSGAWMAGYAFTWMGKAVIGSLLTDQNVIADVLEQAAFRTTGDFASDNGPQRITARAAIGKNLETFFMGSNAVFFAMCLVVYALRILVKRAPVSAWMNALPVAAVTLYPFVWYAVLQNHVRMHFWMTNKMLAVTVFAAFAYMAVVAGKGSAACEDSDEKTSL